MILLADGGSTKTEWRATGKNASHRSVYTPGINPFFLGSEDIYALLSAELSIGLDKKSDKRLRKEEEIIYNEYISEVWFYGTGVNSPSKEKIVSDALKRLFPDAEIHIASDLLGAARSLCRHAPGIACIMGTGSNSCYYDGKAIISNVSPLGYILGDEGGGAFIGRKLVSGVLKKQFSGEVIKRFNDTYHLTKETILENVYMKPFPNRFLGQFSKFISSNPDLPELKEIVESGFREFISRNILQYPESALYPVHFTGSIAWNFSDLLRGSLLKSGLQPGSITLSPMDNLELYHLETIRNNE